MDPTEQTGAGSPPRRGAVVAAWLVHAYTAAGAALAMFIIMALWEGEIIRALWLGLVAIIVDGTDGMLARKLRVKQTIPWFDGALLDNIVDYLTYVFAPMVLLWSAGYLGEGPGATFLAVLPLLASAYQFCRVDAKTEDHLFLGFPSYWNILAFYVVILDLGTVPVAALLVVCSALVFLPVGYVYPSRTDTLWATTLTLTTLWLVSYAVLLVQAPDPSPFWLAMSLVYLAYYIGLSAFLTSRRHLQRSSSDESPAGETPTGELAEA